MVPGSGNGTMRSLRSYPTASAGCASFRQPLVPWWNYFLEIVRSGYREFAFQVEPPDARPAKSDMVRRAVQEQTGVFTLADLRHQLPTASQQLIRKVLSEMKKEDLIRLEGRGAGAIWEIKRSR